MKAAFLAIMFCCVGCTSTSDYSRSTPALSALAESIQMESTRQVHTVRWNPANCDCPEWELKLRDRWLRVSLSPMGKVSAEDLEAQKQGKTFEVEGPLSASPFRCGATLLCGSLGVTALPSRTEAVP